MYSVPEHITMFGATAARTSPLACLVAGTAPVLLARLTGKVAPPRPWSATARKRTGQIAGVIVAGSWVFQLHRFGFLQTAGRTMPGCRVNWRPGSAGPPAGC
jgi:hypothetical protein